MELVNVTNTTSVLDVLTGECGLQTIGSLVLVLMFGLSEAMPFLGDAKKNNGLIQTSVKLLLSLCKKRQDNALEMSSVP
jgi:hypothetical protein